MAAGTKDRIMETTAQLFQRYGYTGTGLKQIVAEANAPFGSIYHHFPNGKAQLGEEVIRRSGQMYKELFEAIFDAAPDVGARPATSSSAPRRRCARPTTPTRARSRPSRSRSRARTNRCARRRPPCSRAGPLRAPSASAPPASPSRRPARLTIVFLAALEGAFVLCRATRTEALEVTGAQMTALVREALNAG